MKKLKLGIVAVFLCFLGHACSGNDSGGKRLTRIAGNKSFEASIFRQNCAICHGPEANGKVLDGQQVPSLRIGPASKKTEEEIYQQIAVGKMPMPSFEGQLTEKQMRLMATFIFREIQGRETDKTVSNSERNKASEKTGASNK